MAQEAQKAIEITEFVPASAIDPVYFDGPYYVGPGQGRREGLPPAQRGDEEDRALGARQVGGPRASSTWC